MKQLVIFLAMMLLLMLGCDGDSEDESGSELEQIADTETAGVENRGDETDPTEEADRESSGEKNTGSEQSEDTAEEKDTATATGEQSDSAPGTEPESATDTGTIMDTDSSDTTPRGEPPCYGVTDVGCCRGKTVFWCWNDGTDDHLGEEDCGSFDCGYSKSLDMFKCKLGGGDPLPEGMTRECPAALP